MLFGPLECRFADLASCWSCDDANRDSQIGSGNSGERLEFWMRGKRGAHLFRRITPFHAGIEAFCVLAKDDDIHERFLNASVAVLAHEVQRIPGKRNARANARIEIELLPHGYDGTEIRIALASQFGSQ